MRRPLVIAGSLAVVLAGWLGWQLWSEGPAAPSRHEAQDAAHSTIPRGPPANSVDAPPPEPASVPDVQPTREASPPAAAPDPTATWIVEGRTLRGWKEPCPSVGVRLRLFAGYEATGTPIQEAHVESDAEGRYRWPLPPPTGTVTLQAKGEQEGHYSYGDSATAVVGTPPPSLDVHFFPKDCAITGVVRGEGGRPIAAALVHGGEDETRSGEDGRYRIAASSVRGESMIVATAPGYAQCRVTAQLSGPGSSAVANFDLVPSFRVQGRVVDEAGAPVEGAAVRSFFTGENGATTDPQGRFLLDHLDPGRRSHSVYARKDGYCEAATNVEVDGALRTIPDLVLTRGVRLEGRVVGEGGAPLAGARLYLGFSPSAYNRLDAVSQDDGTFVFQNVPTGEQTLVTSHPDFAPDRRVLALAPSPTTVSGMVIPLARAHFIGGVVRDEAGSPLHEVWISARHAGDYIDGRAQTSEDGRFVLKGLPASDVSLELFGVGFVRKSVPLAELDHERLEIVVQRAGKVAGRVVDGVTGAALNEFVIRFTRPDAPDTSSFGYSATWVREGRRFTATDGFWDSGDEELPPGGVLGIEARADGYAPARVGRVVVALAPDPAACVLRMFAGARVGGRIVDASGAAVAAARVAIKSAADPSRHFSDEPYEAGTTQSGDDGSFALAAVTAGPSVLLVQAAGRPLFVDGPFEVPTTGSIDRVVALPSGSTLTGEVLDADGAPQAGAAIVLHASEVAGLDPYSKETTTDADGRFEFSGLPDGLYQVSQAERDGEQSTYVFTRFARIGAGGKNHVVLQPSGAGSITGTITMKDGSAVPPRLSVMLNAVADRTSAREDAAPGRGALARDGRFVIDAIPPGDYTAQVFFWSSNRRLHGSARVTVNDDEQAVQIELAEMPARGR